MPALSSSIAPDVVTFAGVISGSGGVGQAGTGTTILTGANTYAGGTTVLQGTLQIGNGGTSGIVGTGAVVNSGTLVFNRSDDTTFYNTFSGSGTLIQNGVDTLTLFNPYQFGGNTTVNSGTLIANLNSGSLNTGTVNVAAAGTLVLQRTAGGGFTGASFTFSNPIVGAGTVLLNFGYNVDCTLGQSNSGFSGNLTLTPQSSTFRIDALSPAALGTATIVVNNGAQLLAFSSATPYANNITINGIGWNDPSNNAYYGALRQWHERYSDAPRPGPATSSSGANGGARITGFRARPATILLTGNISGGPLELWAGSTTDN